MAIFYEKLLNLAIPTNEQTFAPKDAMLYALGVGLGLDPMDRGQLDFVCDLPTTPQAALIYRLSADVNPLHADPTSPTPPDSLGRSCMGWRPMAWRGMRS